MHTTKRVWLVGFAWCRQLYTRYVFCLNYCCFFYSFYAVAPQVSFLLVIALYWTLYWTSLEKCYLNKIVIITHQLTLKLLLSAFRSTETWAPPTGCIPTVSSTPFSASVSTVIHIEHFTSKYVPICVVLQWLGHHIDEYVMPLMNWESISYVAQWLSFETSDPCILWQEPSLGGSGMWQNLQSWTN